MPRPGTFKPGKDARRARGGWRENAGRKTSEYKKKMAAIASSDEALQLYEDAITGKRIDEKVTDRGKRIAVKPPSEVRLKFLKSAEDRGYGRVKDEVELTAGKTFRDFLLSAFGPRSGDKVSDEGEE